MAPEENARNDMLFEIKQFTHAMHRHQYSLMALALGFALSAWLWVGTAAPAQRSTPAPAPPPTEAERAVALFKAKAEQFQRFLSQTPVFLSNQDFSKSPTSEIYYHVRVKLLKSGFDVQRSDSLISPFIGYLYLTYDAEDTISCGDVIVTYPGGTRDSYGYSTRDKAMARLHDCFRPWRRSSPDDVRLSFAYQDGRWVLKDALCPKYNNQAESLLAALGQAKPPHHRVPDNQAWEALIK